LAFNASRGLATQLDWRDLGGSSGDLTIPGRPADVLSRMLFEKPGFGVAFHQNRRTSILREPLKPRPLFFRKIEGCPCLIKVINLNYIQTLKFK
jgi:hypothetical protein